MRHRRFIALLLSFVLVWNACQPAVACIWDSDTLAAEAKGLPNVVAVIVGRFERQPPKYYEMRLARVTKLLEENPQNLAAYDDAGVACDRLGRGDEAIAWMEKKKAVLDEVDSSDPSIKQHRYRYFANVGTFWVHRWFKNGADRAKLDEVRTGRDFIAQAIKLNPDAHFGREKYQLMAIDLILREPEQPPPDADTNYEDLPSLLELSGELPYLSHYVKDEGALQQAGVSDAVKGLTGLIALGNAWESVDVYYALSLALQAEGRSQLAYLATQRVNELVDEGKKSFVARAPEGDALRKKLEQRLHHPVDVKPALDSFFQEARASADEWITRRNGYMEKQFAAGRHPDTHEDFWLGWADAPKLPELPEIEGGPNWDRAIRNAMIFGGTMIVLAIVAVIGIVWLIVRMVRSSNRSGIHSPQS